MKKKTKSQPLTIVCHIRIPVRSVIRLVRWLKSEGIQSRNPSDAVRITLSSLISTLPEKVSSKTNTELLAELESFFPGDHSTPALAVKREKVAASLKRTQETIDIEIEE